MSAMIQYAEPLSDGLRRFRILDDPCPACGFPDRYAVLCPDGESSRPCPNCGAQR